MYLGFFLSPPLSSASLFPASFWAGLRFPGSSLSNPSAKRASLLKKPGKDSFWHHNITCLHLPIPWPELEGGKDGGDHMVWPLEN